MSVRNLIVDDEYFSKIQEFYGRRREVDSDMLSNYLEVLEASREHAIRAGDVATALDAFIPYVAQLKGRLESISTDLRDLARSYVNAIDAADDFLF